MLASGEKRHEAANDPEQDLQKFEDIHHYARNGRMPWRVFEELAVQSEREQETHSSAKIIHVSRRFFEDRLKSRFETDLSRASVEALLRRSPSASAHRLLMPGQRVIAISLLMLLALAFAMAPLAVLIAVNVSILLYFLTVIIFRLYLAVTALRLPPGSTPNASRLRDAVLPVVTVLLPLYDEAEALTLLSAAINKIDYPPAKLDVKLLLEEDDEATITSALRLGLHLKYDMIVLPPSEPRTKPKACNHALYLARGDLIVIYDAEDMPEADQLRKTAAVFAASATDVACVQARLNYYNANENWLTRLFALEYALWFDSLLPALEKIRAPIPFQISSVQISYVKLAAGIRLMSQKTPILVCVSRAEGIVRLSSIRPLMRKLTRRLETGLANVRAG